MRVRLAPDDLLERLAIALNLAPLPGGYAMYGMVAGRVPGVAQKLGIFAKLLDGPATGGRLAEELGLQVAGTRLLCENLAGLGILEQDGHTFSLAKRARRWLDPHSDTYIGTWLEHTASYWRWYDDLERVLQDGGASRSIPSRPRTTPTGAPTSPASTSSRGSPPAKRPSGSSFPPARALCSTSLAATGGSRRRCASATRR